MPHCRRLRPAKLQGIGVLRQALFMARDHRNVGTVHPADRMAWPLYEVIAEHKLPAIFHTGHSGMGTGLPGGGVESYLPDDCVSVYVPTTPNPTGGYFVMLRKSECVELNMSVDEALKYIVSMGVVVPGGPSNPNVK